MLCVHCNIFVSEFKQIHKIQHFSVCDLNANDLAFFVLNMYNSCIIYFFSFVCLRLMCRTASKSVAKEHINICQPMGTGFVPFIPMQTHASAPLKC